MPSTCLEGFPHRTALNRSIVLTARLASDATAASIGQRQAAARLVKRTRCQLATTQRGSTISAASAVCRQNAQRCAPQLHQLSDHQRRLFTGVRVHRCMGHHSSDRCTLPITSRICCALPHTLRQSLRSIHATEAGGSTAKHPWPACAHVHGSTTAPKLSISKELRRHVLPRTRR